MTRQFVYVGSYDVDGMGAIYLLELDPEAGALSAPRVAARVHNASFLALHPTGAYLYSINRETTDGAFAPAVTSYAIDGETGLLTILNSRTSGGMNPCHIAVDPEGKNVLVAHFGSGSVSVLPIQADGRIGAPSCVLPHEAHGEVDGVPRKPHAHGTYMTGDGRFALCPDLGADAVFVHRFDADAGTLRPNTPPSIATAPGSGPRHLALHPSERYAYVLSERKSTLAAYAFDSVHGILREVQVLSTLPDGFTGSNQPAEVGTDREGRFVYATNRGHDSIAAFQIDPATGRLTPAGCYTACGRSPRSFAFDLTGRFMVVVNQDSGNTVLLKVDPETGALSPTSQEYPTLQAATVVFLAADRR